MQINTGSRNVVCNIGWTDAARAAARLARQLGQDMVDSFKEDETVHTDPAELHEAMESRDAIELSKDEDQDYYKDKLNYHSQRAIVMRAQGHNRIAGLHSQAANMYGLVTSGPPHLVPMRQKQLAHQAGQVAIDSETESRAASNIPLHRKANVPFAFGWS